MIRITLPALAGALLLGGVACADSITLVGSTIPMRDCRIQAVEGGRVHFVDPRGRRQLRDLENVAALGFDDLPALDEAEAALAAGDLDGALRGLLAAKVRTDRPIEHLWLRVRLARVHDLRGEYVQAAGHAAAAFLLSDDASWQRLVPVCPVDEPTYAAALEAHRFLAEARRKVRSRELRGQIDRMMEQVEPVLTGLAAAYDGPPVAVGSTVSGLAVADVEAGRIEIRRIGHASKPETSAPEEPAPIDAAPKPATTPDPEPDAGSVEALLAAGRYAEAVARCRAIAADPGDRDLASFLLDYGRALAGAGRTDDAAIMLTRCALLHRDTAAGQWALIETARLYRDRYDRPATARRLLERVLDGAATIDQPDLIARARAELETLRAP